MRCRRRVSSSRDILRVPGDGGPIAHVKGAKESVGLSVASFTAD